MSRTRYCGLIPTTDYPRTGPQVVHPIDESSPLYGATPEDVIAMRAEIIAVLDGIDEKVSDNYQVKWSYVADEIVWGAKFVPMVSLIPRPPGMCKCARVYVCRACVLRAGVSLGG